MWSGSLSVLPWPWYDENMLDEPLLSFLDFLFSQIAILIFFLHTKRVSVFNLKKNTHFWPLHISPWISKESGQPLFSLVFWLSLIFPSLVLSMKLWMRCMQYKHEMNHLGGGQCLVGNLALAAFLRPLWLLPSSPWRCHLVESIRINGCVSHYIPIPYLNKKNMCVGVNWMQVISSEEHGSEKIRKITLAFATVVIVSGLLCFVVEKQFFSSLHSGIKVPRKNQR